MPFVFPKRFLRTRDILDPLDMNKDDGPVMDLIEGKLDRHNFYGPDLKNAKFSASPFGAAGTPAVDYDAYQSLRYASVECPVRFHHAKSNDGTGRKPPNFVELDGSTFRHTISSPSNDDGYPSIIPNSGEWSAVKTGDLSGPLQETFTTGRSSVWLCAHLQYVWQGFYEYKHPWAASSQDSNRDITAGARHQAALALYERDTLNKYGPSANWRAFKNWYTSGVIPKHNVPYAYPLHEPSAEDERRDPRLAGYHHISRGFYPSLVQFALRVDGKIIDESITGKRLSMEESTHGLRVNDSPFMAGALESSAGVFGQRSMSRAMSYEDDDKARPGQKLKSSRAVACGPEVMPVRIGALVSLEPGSHTIEIVARRLQRKKLKFLSGDFVGVFSRRLLSVELPMYAPRQDGVDELDSQRLQSYGVETEVNDRRLATKRQSIADRLNAVRESDVFRGTFPNTHLPSKVVYSNTVTITPTYSFDEASGAYDTVGTASAARFPGQDSAYIDRVATNSMSGWGQAYAGTHGAGWFMVTQDTASASATKLSIESSELTTTADEQLVLLADIDLQVVKSVLSMDGAYASLGQPAESFPPGGPSTTSGEIETAEKLLEKKTRFTNFIMTDRYLDRFAMFAIGYRTGSNWTIASEFSPAVVNTFNWANRTKAYVPVFTHEEQVYPIPPATGTTPSEYAAETEQDTKWDAHFGTQRSGTSTDRRGNQALPSNLGVNVPLMAVVESTQTIDEVAVFCCTEFPSFWDDAEVDPEPMPQWAKPRTPFGTPGGGTGFHPAAEGYVDYTWASPLHRNILKGLHVFWGNGRLTALKIKK